jgi:hypothetical protein
MTLPLIARVDHHTSTVSIINPRILGTIASCPMSTLTPDQTLSALGYHRTADWRGEDMPTAPVERDAMPDLDHPQTCTPEQRATTELAADVMRRAVGMVLTGGKLALIRAIIMGPVEERLAELLADLATEAEANGPNHHALTLARALLGETP